MRGRSVARVKWNILKLDFKEPETVCFGEEGAVTPCRRVEDRKGAGTNSGKSGTVRGIGDWEHQKQGGEYVSVCKAEDSHRDTTIHKRIGSSMKAVTDWMIAWFIFNAQSTFNVTRARREIKSQVWCDWTKNEKSHFDHRDATSLSPSSLKPALGCWFLHACVKCSVTKSVRSERFFP